MSAELAIVEPQQGIDVERWAQTLVFAAQLAERVHDTEFVPKALRGRPDAVAATIMYGAEVGVTPMQALAGIHIVDGRPSPSAELMRAMILRAGHSFTIHEMTGTRVRVSGLRRGRPEPERVVVDWSIDMARAAGLLGKQNWRNYPRAMLTARAFGDLARVLFADVVKGLSVVAEDISVDELQRWDTDGPDTAPEPPRKPLQRRQRRKVAPAPTDEPSEPQIAPAELPPVTPPYDPHAATSPDGAAGEGEGEAPEPAAPDEPQPPRYEPDDVQLPDELTRPFVPPEPEQLPPEAPIAEAGPPKLGEGMLKAVHAGLTRELGTVATRQERHGLVAAILGYPIESTKDLRRDEGFRVVDMLGRFEDGTASWQLDLATDAYTVTDTREPPS